MRLFLALELPKRVQSALGTTQRSMQSLGRSVRWVSPEAMHITLVFLGETEAGLLSTLGVALRGALANHKAVTLSTAGAGAFPSARSPQVLWAGISGETAALGALQAEVAEALVPLGFPRESRRFTPHVTIGRVTRNATATERAAAGNAIDRAIVESHTWRAETVTLFESELKPSGPVYSARDTIPLQA